MRFTVAHLEEFRRHNAAVERARADYEAHPNTSCYRCGELVPAPPRCKKCAEYVAWQRETRRLAKEAS